MDDVYREIIPLALSALVSILGWFFARAMIAVRERFGAETEKLLRDELGKAIARALAAKGGARSPDPVGEVLEYLEQTMPDTLARLGASHEALASRIAVEIGRDEERL